MNDLDPNELDAEADASPVTKIGILRKLYPAIDRKLREGRWTARELVEWLGKRGVEMSVEHFRVYLRDLDRENGFVRSKKQTTKQPAPRKPQVQKTKPAAVVSSDQQRSNESVKQATESKGKFDLPKAKRFEHPATPPEDLLK